MNVISLLLFVILGFTPVGLAFASDLSYSGSSTIGTGILQDGALASFEKQTGLKFARVDILGSGKGLKILAAGGTVIAGSSRPLKPEEIKDGLVGTVIGYDAIAIFVHDSNPVKNLTREQLKGIFTGQIKNWKEVGGNDAAIVPNTEVLNSKRATMEIFQEQVMDGAAYGKGFKEIEFPRDQIVELAANPNGICTVSMGLLAWTSVSVQGRVKTLAVDGFEPNAKNIHAHKYPIARPLLLVTKGAPQDQAKRFIDFMLSPTGQTVVKHNFVGIK